MADGTFLRKLDQTELVNPPSQCTLEEVSLNQSLGANLLQIMQANPPQQFPVKAKPKRGGLRNFNFRCNLDEIDKIIEEDFIQEQQATERQDQFKEQMSQAPTNPEADGQEPSA